MNLTSTPIVLKTKAILITAVLFGLIGCTVTYFYLAANPKELFSKNYHPYELPVMRGAGDHSALKTFYTSGNMDSVIWQFNSIKSPQPEDYLLTGIAFLEKNQPAEAIESFKTLIQINTNSKQDYFEQDAEYYLAMSYLSNNESDKAMPIFEKIKADADHPYNGDVSNWFLMNVKNSIAKQ